jgi:copper oxidase (laccase) domain-containing protein
VLRAFGVDPDPAVAMPADSSDAAPHFLWRPRVDGSSAWLADLRGLASLRLRDAGASQISASADCTVEDRSRFFSFRRDGVCGRMVAAVWIRS